jgi:hypothetical protein
MPTKPTPAPDRFKRIRIESDPGEIIMVQTTCAKCGVSVKCSIAELEQKEKQHIKNCAKS